MVEDETLDGGLKNGGKEELGEGEWVALERREDMGFLCALEWRRGGVYIVVVEEIWMECHLMRVDKESWT